MLSLETLTGGTSRLDAVAAVALALLNSYGVFMAASLTGFSNCDSSNFRPTLCHSPTWALGQSWQTSDGEDRQHLGWARRRERGKKMVNKCWFSFSLQDKGT